MNLDKMYKSFFNSVWKFSLSKTNIEQLVQRCSVTYHYTSHDSRAECQDESFYQVTWRPHSY